MSRTDNIIEAYITADSETRLYLYLQYPPLRDEFIRIDLSKKLKPTEAGKTRNKYSKGSRRRWWRAVMNNCCLRLRRY